MIGIGVGMETSYRCSDSVADLRCTFESCAETNIVIETGTQGENPGNL